MGSFNYIHHKYMIGVYSHLVLVFVGYVASLFYPTKTTDDSLTYYGYLRLKKEQKMK